MAPDTWRGGSDSGESNTNNNNRSSGRNSEGGEASASSALSSNSSSSSSRGSIISVISSSSSSSVTTTSAQQQQQQQQHPKPHWEHANMTLLLALYFLQGIPMGLAGSVPLFLASMGASFTDQAVFLLASWPYALKLLWAPIVDALYTTKYRLGHRKSWVIPVQIITGIVMISLGASIHTFFGPSGGAEGGVGAVVPPPSSLGEEVVGGISIDASHHAQQHSTINTTSSSSSVPLAPTFTVNVHGLLACFFMLYALVATQDIAVDGWALTMLKPENVGFASTANTVGQQAGFLTSYSLFLALDSKDVSNTYIRKPFNLPEQDYGLVTMGGFMQFWGAVFIFSTLIIWVAKAEDLPHSSSSFSTDHSSDTEGEERDDDHSLSEEENGAEKIDGSVNVLTSENDDDDDDDDESKVLVIDSTNSNNNSNTGNERRTRMSSGGREAAAAAGAGAATSSTTSTTTSNSSSSSTSNGVRRRSNGRSSVEKSIDGSNSGGIDGAHTVSANAITEEGRNNSNNSSSSSSRGNSRSKIPLPKKATDDTTTTEGVDSAEREDEEAEDNSLLHQVRSQSAATSSSSSLSSSPSTSVSSSSSHSLWKAVWQNYVDFWSILCLKPVLSLVFIMITFKAGFQATDRATSLIAQAHGIPKESLALLDTISSPFQVAIPLFLAHFTAGRSKSLKLLVTAYPARILFGLVYLWVLYVALPDRHANPWKPGDVPWYVLALFFVVSNLHAVIQTFMFMGQMSFFTHVAAPNAKSLGGTYITLLNTMSNLGGMWPGPPTLRAIDAFTVMKCEYAPAIAATAGPGGTSISPWGEGGGGSMWEAASKLTCKGTSETAACNALGGVCGTAQDGYILLVLVGTVYSTVWWLFMRKRVLHLQDLPSQSWKVVPKT